MKGIDIYQGSVPFANKQAMFTTAFFTTLYTLTSVCIFPLLFGIHFVLVLKTRICLTIKSFLTGCSFSIFS